MAGSRDDTSRSAGLIGVQMSDDNFNQLSTYIERQSGIKMPARKRIMLNARLLRRLRDLRLNSFDDYCRYVFSPEGSETEVVHMLDVVTTNETRFFREQHHFDYLKDTVLPEFQSTCKHITKAMRVWSAGCSTGEEPYSIAMVMQQFSQQYTEFVFAILATDLSTRVLEHASKAIYTEERVEKVPPLLKKKYFLKSKNPSKKIVRVMPDLCQRITFRRLNFMDNRFCIRAPLHIIFCRNVLIYFKPHMQEKLVKNFCRYLAPGGYLFIGHSESLQEMDLPVTQVAPTVYRRSG